MHAMINLSGRITRRSSHEGLAACTRFPLVLPSCFSSCFTKHLQKKGFVEKLVQRIVDNIEIKVADIHIRYPW